MRAAFCHAFSSPIAASARRTAYCRTRLPASPSSPGAVNVKLTSVDRLSLICPRRSLTADGAAGSALTDQFAQPAFPASSVTWRKRRTVTPAFGVTPAEVNQCRAIRINGDWLAGAAPSTRAGSPRCDNRILRNVDLNRAYVPLSQRRVRSATRRHREAARQTTSGLRGSTEEPDSENLGCCHQLIEPETLRFVALQ